jgi:hypothetical protein
MLRKLRKRRRAGWQLGIGCQALKREARRRTEPSCSTSRFLVSASPRPARAVMVPVAGERVAMMPVMMMPMTIIYRSGVGGVASDNWRKRCDGCGLCNPANGQGHYA